MDLLKSLCPTDLIVFYNEMTSMVINMIGGCHLPLFYNSKAFETASCNILISKLICFGLDSIQVDMWKASQWLGWLMGWTPPGGQLQVEYCRICTKPGLFNNFISHLEEAT